MARLDADGVQPVKAATPGDEAQRIAVNIAKLPEPLTKQSD